jgi:hypothetical protein
MGPNAVELVRVFTRQTGEVIADITFPFTNAFEAVIDCEAGTALHSTGARYELKITVVDFSLMKAIVRSGVLAVGFLGDAGWPGLGQQFVFPIPAAGAQNEGHIGKIFASLKVGVVNPYASLAESNLFLITAP